MLGGERPLGELQLEQVGRHAVLGQRLRHRAGELHAVQVPGRHVDRDRNLQALGAPLRHLAQRLVDDERGQPVHQARSLRQGDELVRRDEAPVRVVPSQQRLHPDDAAVEERHLGLVVQGQLAVVDGLAQRGQQAQPVGRVTVAGRVVHLDLGVALLRLVHRHVSGTQQLLDVHAVLRGQRDAHAALQLQRDVTELERLLQRGQHPLGDLAGVDPGQHPRQVEGELVAAEPGHRVVRAQHPTDPHGHHLQQPVPYMVPQGVVDLLEPVEVEQAQPEGLRVGAFECLLEGPQEVLAVGESGQRVVQGLVLLLERDLGGLVHGEQRDEQQRDVPGAHLGGERDERGQREYRGTGHDVVPEVLEERLAEPSGQVRRRDGGHQHVVDEEPDDPGRDHPPEVTAGELHVDAPTVHPEG